MSQIIPRGLIKHLEWDPNKRNSNPRPAPIAVSPAQNPVVPNLEPSFAEFVQVGINGISGNPVVISPFELAGYNNMNYDNTHFKLLENGLYMPTPQIFAAHIRNVFDAHKNGKKMLYADGREIPADKVEEFYDHLTKNAHNSYGASNIGAWTWLNARFVEGSGWNNLDLEIVNGMNKGKRELETSRVKLEDCFEEDCWVDYSFNEQGLIKPNSKSANQSNVIGETLRYWYPRKDYVARFEAYSDGANLYCDRVPSFTDSSLGVFGCAEGAIAKNSGGSS